MQEQNLIINLSTIKYNKIKQNKKIKRNGIRYQKIKSNQKNPVDPYHQKMMTDAAIHTVPCKKGI